MGRVLAVLMMLSIAPVASAAVMTFTEGTTPGGLLEFVFTADCTGDSPIPEPIWVEMTYTEYDTATHSATYGLRRDGTLNNVDAFGSIQVDIEQDADIYDPLDPGYSKVEDSWFYLAFTKKDAPTSPVQGLAGGATTDNYMYIDSGMPAAWYSYVEQHAHIVCTGDVVFEGRIGFSNVWYPIAGVTPEPATLLLLAVGAVGFVLRRRR
jgi:hypothetical protein